MVAIFTRKRILLGLGIFFILLAIALIFLTPFIPFFDEAISGLIGFALILGAMSQRA